MQLALEILIWFAAISVAANLCWLVPLALWLGKSLMDDLREERKYKKH